jgi:hypothetical protein
MTASEPRTNASTRIRCVKLLGGNLGGNAWAPSAPRIGCEEGASKCEVYQEGFDKVPWRFLREIAAGTGALIRDGLKKVVLGGMPSSRMHRGLELDGKNLGLSVPWFSFRPLW